MEIKEIKIRELDIPVWKFSDPSTSLPTAAPVVVNIGIPVVDMPGCVEAHNTNSKSKTLGQDDKDGLTTYCDSGVPSFNPIQYEPEQMILTEPAKTPKVNPPKAPEVPKTPEIPNTPASTAKVDCPTPAQEAKEPVGTMVEGFRKKVIGYELVGNQCIQRTEKVPLPQQVIAGLPSAGTVVTTGGIAVVATSSALLAKPLADLLLKVIKPTVKKVMKKIATIRKKPIPVQSVGDRRAEQRQMNHAIRELRSVFPRKKKK